MSNEAIEQLQAEIKELMERTSNLDAQIYTLKANIKTVLAFQSNEPGSSGIELHEVVNLLENWANFEVPDVPDGS